jgi:type I restriction enzyme M protein
MANLKGIIDSIGKIMWQDTGLNGDAQRIVAKLDELMVYCEALEPKEKEVVG